MKWLTDKDENTILNIDANGIGHKFFISKTGKLIGTVPPEIAITDPLINSVLSRGN
jgi:hypothetical protein